MPVKCNHEDTRLSCVECNAPICSNCMVQCPVGFRCKKCIGEATKPLRAGTPSLVARTFLLCAGIGFGAGTLMPFIRIPFISCFICYFIGLFAGRALSKTLDFRIADHAGKIIFWGLLGGLLLTKIGTAELFMLGMLPAALMSGTIIPILGGIVGMLFNPVCFFIGVLRATVWGERW